MELSPNFAQKDVQVLCLYLLCSGPMLPFLLVTAGKMDFYRP
jgi:hypothetical protein